MCGLDESVLSAFSAALSLWSRLLGLVPRQGPAGPMGPDGCVCICRPPRPSAASDPWRAGPHWGPPVVPSSPCRAGQERVSGVLEHEPRSLGTASVFTTDHMSWFRVRNSDSGDCGPGKADGRVLGPSGEDHGGACRPAPEPSQGAPARMGGTRTPHSYQPDGQTEREK